MGCWVALWSAVLLAVLKAMGQKAHLWKTWQCRSWMWLFSKAKVRWTTPQWMHLDDRGWRGRVSDPEVVLETEGWRAGTEPSWGPSFQHSYILRAYLLPSGTSGHPGHP